MEGFSFKEINQLKELIAPQQKDSDSDSDDDNLKQRLSRQKIGPGSIGTTKEATKPSDASASPESLKDKVKESDIWHPAEVNKIADFQNEDPREIPQYEMKFKQSVGTEDIYLGMNMKTPATASCQWMTLLVKLPDEQREKLELSVETEYVDLRSPKYRLQLPTPFPVDPNGSSAKWHSDSSCLEITLKLTRELDDVNF